MNEELSKMLEPLFCMASDSNEVEQWFCLCIIASNVDIVSVVIMEIELKHRFSAYGIGGNAEMHELLVVAVEMWPGPLLLPDSSGNGGSPPMLNLLSRTVQAIGGKRDSLSVTKFANSHKTSGGTGGSLQVSQKLPTLIRHLVVLVVH
ncbi:hypothetical protein DFH09DRAFT_1101852 [Mycena vulgaris]|nr:hypothetical protein DFH09DRAFT_1101852 [Mycena vulgaris]